MKSLRTFAQKVSDAALKPQTYGKHLNEKTSTGLGYLYWLLVCCFTVTALFLAALYIPARIGIQAFVNGSEPQLRAAFPAELVLTLDSGALSTNVKQPYVIDPSFWMVMKKNDNGAGTPTHFVTIDTKGTMDTFAKYDSEILLTRNYAISMRDGQLRAFALSEVHKNMVLNKDSYNAIITKMMPLIHSVPFWIDIFAIIGLILLPFVGAGLSWAWHLLTLLGWSLIFWGVSYLMGKGLRYGQVYRLGLYALTLPLLVSTIFGFLHLFGPFLSNLLFVIFMIIALRMIPSPVMKAPKKVAAPVKKAVKAPKKAVKRTKKAKPLA